MNWDLSKIEAFEICSIRPPTENYSLTFRLARNCGWNRCRFCPVYKLGARFKRRTLEEVKADVDRAALLNNALDACNVVVPGSMEHSYQEAARFIKEVSRFKGTGNDWKAGPLNPDPVTEEEESLSWFSSWFKERPTIEDSVYHLLAWRLNGSETCFLGDADSLILPTGFVTESLRYIRSTFPAIRRFTIYGRTSSAARKSPEDLLSLKEAGLDRVHFGVESGSDRVLKHVNKGITAEQHVRGCRKTKEAGISSSLYVMPGLGGSAWSEEHAAETARVITEAEPDFVRIRTLEIFPGTGLSIARDNGEFVEATEEQAAREIRTLVEKIDIPVVIVSDSASNLLDVNGRLPGDRKAMLNVIDEYLALSPRGKLLFSFSSRLNSFVGQYGGVTEDIISALSPYLRGDSLDISGASDADLERITRLIRSKLMP